MNHIFTQKKIRAFVFQKERVSYLAVPTGISEKKRAILTISDYKKTPGWLINEEKVEEWYFSGMTIRNGESCLYGQYYPHKTLEEVLHLNPEEALPCILKLIRSILVLNYRGIDFFNFQTDSILFIDTGSILILPPAIMNRIKDIKGESYKICTHEIINNPYLEGENAKVYSIGILLYRIFTGSYPYIDESQEELRNKMRRLSAVPVELLVPELKDDISLTIMNILKIGNLYTLNELQELIEKWLEEGLYKKISEDEKRATELKLIAFKERSDRQFKLNIIIEKHGKTIVITASIVIAIGLVIISILSGIFKPRLTRGFTAIKVVESFYKSMNSLDDHMMKDCYINEAGSVELNEVTTMFIASRYNIAFEGVSYYVSATDWEAEGRPVLKPPYYVYGVLDLKITQIDGEPEFIVEYEKWLRKENDKEQDTVDIYYEGYRMKDKVKLILDNEGWVIFEKINLEKVPITEEGQGE